MALNKLYAELSTNEPTPAGLLRGMPRHSMVTPIEYDRHTQHSSFAHLKDRLTGESLDPDLVAVMHLDVVDGACHDTIWVRFCDAILRSQVRLVGNGLQQPASKHNTSRLHWGQRYIF
jgi:hypothetical protein